LPKHFVYQLLERVPDLGGIFSYIFTGEDMISTEDFLIKDLQCLTLYRKKEDLIVIDLAETDVDEDNLSQIALH
jgi:hypothetical protein